MMDFSGCSSGGLSVFQNVRFPVVLRHFGQSFYCPSEVRLADKRSERPLRTRLSRLLMALPPRIFLVGIHHDRQPILWDPVYLYADGPSIEEIEGWRWGVSVTRDYEEGEQAALVVREKQIREEQA